MQIKTLILLRPAINPFPTTDEISRQSLFSLPGGSGYCDRSSDKELSFKEPLEPLELSSSRREWWKWSEIKLEQKVFVSEARRFVLHFDVFHVNIFIELNILWVNFVKNVEQMAKKQ